MNKNINNMKKKGIKSREEMIFSENENLNNDVEETEVSQDTNDYIELAVYNDMINQKDEEINQWKNKYMYTLSDFDTYKRNAIKEKSNITKYAAEKVIKEILPIIDDFERSFEHMDDTVREGITLIYNKFINVLNNYDVKLIKPEVGDEFTEDLHEAVSAIPATSEEQKGTIVDCIERGYMLSDKVIRYAKVIVFN